MAPVRFAVVQPKYLPTSLTLESCSFADRAPVPLKVCAETLETLRLPPVDGICKWFSMGLLAKPNRYLQ